MYTYLTNGARRHSRWLRMCHDGIPAQREPHPIDVSVLTSTVAREKRSPAGRELWSGAAAQFREPPPQPDEQEAPVLEKLGGLLLVRVTYELKDPAYDEEYRGQFPTTRHDGRRSE